MQHFIAKDFYEYTLKFDFGAVSRKQFALVSNFNINKLQYYLHSKLLHATKWIVEQSQY